MHLIGKYEGSKMREISLSPVPFGAGFFAGEVAKGVVLEIHGSDVTEEGPDYCVFQLKDAQGDIVAMRRIGGY